LDYPLDVPISSDYTSNSFPEDVTLQNNLQQHGLQVWF